MKVVVIPEPVLQPDITKEDMDLKWNLLKELPEVDELVIKHFDGYPSNEELHPVIRCRRCYRRVGQRQQYK